MRAGLPLLLASVMAFGLSMIAAQAAPPETQRNAAFVFGAQMTDNKWLEIASFNDVSLRDAYLLGGAVSRELTNSRAWALEIEGQVVRHFGNEHHWEFNGALVGRWRDFPWNDSLPTSIAFGIGPSYATRIPREEIAMDGSSAHLLLYWMAELEVGLPERPWSVFTRLHHRSNAYGLLAEDGGSNWLTLGLRHRF